MDDERSYHVGTPVAVLLRQFQLAFADGVQRKCDVEVYIYSNLLDIFISSHFLPLIVAMRYS
jgi:hypothetical protein